MGTEVSSGQSRCRFGNFPLAIWTANLQLLGITILGRLTGVIELGLDRSLSQSRSHSMISGCSRHKYPESVR